MKVDIVSHIYPTTHDPSSGIFIQKEANMLASIYEIAVWIPAVRAFPWQKQYQRSIDPVPESFDVNRVIYFSIPRRLLPTITINNLSTALIQSLSSSEADIIHLHWLFPAGLCIPKIKRALNKPIVLTLHGGDWYSNQNRGYDALIKNALEHADRIICVGKQLTNDVVDTYPNLLQKTHHLPHGIDCTKFIPVSDSEQRSIKRELKWRNNYKHILCVANFYQAKGVELLVEAFGKMNKVDHTHLHLVAPRRDRNIEKTILQLIDRYNLKSNISIYPSMSEDELIKKYRAADFLVSSSRKEGFGLAIAEAIACGLPVLATKSGGPQEIVDQSNGILVDTDNINALSNGLNYMINHFSEYSPTELHHSILNRFSTQAKLDKLDAIYSSLA